MLFYNFSLSFSKNIVFKYVWLLVEQKKQHVSIYPSLITLCIHQDISAEDDRFQITLSKKETIYFRHSLF